MASINVVIETPKGSAQKYDYDEKTHFFEMKKILPYSIVSRASPRHLLEDRRPWGIVVNHNRLSYSTP